MFGSENKAVFQPTLQRLTGLTDDTTPLATGERDGVQMNVKRAPSCCVSLWITSLNSQCQSADPHNLPVTPPQSP